MHELRRLAEFSSSIRINSIPEEVIKAARYCVLDSMGAAIGAAYYEEIPKIIKEITEWAGNNNDRSSAIWAYKHRLPLLDAALLAGIMGHALELDDVHTLSKLHPGAVVVPAAWTLADAVGASGERFLEAVIAGYEVMCRIGQGFGVTSHRKRGWHVTGTAGTFGAAAAAAHIINLDASKTLDSFGIAGTQSSGLWAFLADGASCKKLHPARAINSGITAALLAKAGMTGPEHILDAEDGGLYRATSDAYDMSLVCKEIGLKYEILYIDKKPYPCCRSSHPPIDAALRIRKNKGIEATQIKEVVVETFEVGVMQCGSPHYPESAVEAKFSIPYVVAAAFVDNEITLEQFKNEKISKTEIKELAAKVSVHACKKYSARYPQRWGCHMLVTLKDGTVIKEAIDDMSGSVKSPLTSKQEKNKFYSLVEPKFGDRKTKELIDIILNIDQCERLPDLCLHNDIF